MRGGLLVCGTASDVGKSHVVTGLCRLLARRGVRVAPFKGQNMSLNSWVTTAGDEIARSQGVQALAAGREPEVAMNPVLLKPTGERASQVVVMGRPLAHLDAAAYHAEQPRLRAVVLDALADLRARVDVVIAEGAGGCAEINLLDRDLVNLPLARDAGLPAVVVGDIDRGGVFAALHGSVALLPDALRERVHGFVVNKFRGDPTLLGAGFEELERRCGVPTLGVLPWLDDVALDAEDSLALDGPRPRPPGPARADHLDVAVIRFPRVANVTDLDPLCLEPGVDVRLVTHPSALGRPDLVVLPGTKATVADLAWLRTRGLDRAILASGASVVGICGGQQMMGRTILDEVESGAGSVDGLGWLDLATTFAPDKVTRRRRGTALGQPVAGYEIHHGRTVRGEGVEPWVHLDDDQASNPGDVEDEGSASPDGRFLGTALHGLFEGDTFRATFLSEVGRRAGRRFVPAGVDFAVARDSQFDRLADLLEAHLDVDALEAIIVQGATPVPHHPSLRSTDRRAAGAGPGTSPGEPPCSLGAFARARAEVRPVQEAAARAAEEHHARLAKPRGSLGVLEVLGCRLAAMAGTSPPPLPVPAAVAVFAADHGVHAQGVTPWPQEVTARIVETVAGGSAAINVLARQVGASVAVVDVGVAHPVVTGPEGPARVLDRRIRAGTADLGLGPAMDLGEAERALDVGAEVAGDLVAGGARCLVTGDLGMANTTAAAALIAALTGRSARETTGRGTGVDDAMLAHKVAVVERALARPSVSPWTGPLGVLASLGGLEIAALAGFIVGGAAARVPVVIDGVIAGAALLAAVSLVPSALAYCVAGHRSTEPGATVVLDHLGLDPVLDLGLRLGEGTGACLAVPVLEAAARILAEMATLDATGVGRAGA